LHLAANSVSTLVNQLIDIGMVVRQTAPDDRRAARLWLTDTAAQRLAAFRQVRVQRAGAEEKRHGNGLLDTPEPVVGERQSGDRNRQAAQKTRA
jgi:DNA-binding MarR family transcriptional regulator